MWQLRLLPRFYWHVIYQHRLPRNVVQYESVSHVQINEAAVPGQLCASALQSEVYIYLHG